MFDCEGGRALERTGQIRVGKHLPGLRATLSAIQAPQDGHSGVPPQAVAARKIQPRNRRQARPIRVGQTPIAGSHCMTFPPCPCLLIPKPCDRCSSAITGFRYARRVGGGGARKKLIPRVALCEPWYQCQESNPHRKIRKSKHIFCSADNNFYRSEKFIVINFSTLYEIEN